MTIQFSAKKQSWRQTDKGYVLTLLIDPTDKWQEVAMSPLGTVYGVAMVEVNAETNQPVENINGEKPRERFGEMPRSKQAGILCADRSFQWWITPDGTIPTEETAAEALRQECKVSSRRHLDTGSVGSEILFDKMVARYRADMGQMAEKR